MLPAATLIKARHDNSTERPVAQTTTLKDYMAALYKNMHFQASKLVMCLLYLILTFLAVCPLLNGLTDTHFTPTFSICTQQSLLPVPTTQGAVFAFSFGLFVWVLTVSLKDKGALSKVVLFSSYTSLSDCITGKGTK